MKNDRCIADPCFDMVSDIVANESNNAFIVQLCYDNTRRWMASVHSKPITPLISQSYYSDIGLYLYRFHDHSHQRIIVTGAAYMNGRSTMSETIELYHPNPDSGINILINYIRKLKRIRDKFTTAIILMNIIVVAAVIMSIISMPIKTSAIIFYAAIVSYVPATAVIHHIYYNAITCVKMTD